jgi:hypothetical protein
VMWLCASMSVSKITTPRKTSKVTLNVFYESRVFNDYVIKISIKSVNIYGNYDNTNDTYFTSQLGKILNPPQNSSRSRK